MQPQTRRVARCHFPCYGAHKVSVQLFCSVWTSQLAQSNLPRLWWRLLSAERRLDVGRTITARPGTFQQLSEDCASLVQGAGAFFIFIFFFCIAILSKDRSFLHHNQLEVHKEQSLEVRLISDVTSPGQQSAEVKSPAPSWPKWNHRSLGSKNWAGTGPD